MDLSTFHRVNEILILLFYDLSTSSTKIVRYSDEMNKCNVRNIFVILNRCICMHSVPESAKYIVPYTKW